MKKKKYKLSIKQGQEVQEFSVSENMFNVEDKIEPANLFLFDEIF